MVNRYNIRDRFAVVLIVFLLSLSGQVRGQVSAQVKQTAVIRDAATNVRLPSQVRIQQTANGAVYRVVVKNAGAADSAVYNVFIPEGVDTVRGVFIHQHGCGMEGRGVSSAYDVQYQAFAKKWRLAIVGPDLYYKSGCYEWRDPESGSGPSLLTAFEKIGKASNHPELKDSPWLLWGHSGGGYWVLAMMKNYPARILAAFCYSPAFDPSWDYPEEALKIPVMIRHAGANDSNSPNGKCWETAINSFHKLRSAGGLASITYTPYQNHNYSFVRYMAIPFYESVLAKRLPKGEAVSFKALRDIDKSGSWLGDTLLLNTYKYTGYPKKRRELSWLPDSVTAAKWKEYSITGTVVDRTPPPAPYGLERKRLHNVAVELRWKADADIESGIKHFNIYKGSQLIARFPRHGVYQRFDTNGDDAIPMSDLPEMKTVVILPVGEHKDITVSTVNHFDLESPKMTVPAFE
ncbi:hypothetical protein EDD80_101426 [Anseongella ginsenosidimutans]|uniref:Uncharacterized protein n=1 Tax=Anseongella ginsenosidimutans TaxID=496056 RepID=A0A4R3KWQ1_9SPHI|nr:hypothetical protein [Anseongella ginsenosidimutans]QEC51110.1 lysophospholipase [Anseongella ginsenosidimutans]TCS90227.1 hypothetical protein EDD80_101426 [Anseongella ginsenosidimutans]